MVLSATAFLVGPYRSATTLLRRYAKCKCVGGGFEAACQAFHHETVATKCMPLLHPHLLLISYVL